MVCLVHRVYGGICTRAEAQLVLHQKFLKFIERHQYKLEIFQPLLICIVSVEGPWKCQSSPLGPHDAYGVCPGRSGAGDHRDRTMVRRGKSVKL